MKMLLKCSRTSFGNNQRKGRFLRAFLRGGFCLDSGECTPWRKIGSLIAGVLASAVLACAATLYKAHPSEIVTADWNPTKGSPPGREYVGDRVCSGCHVTHGTRNRRDHQHIPYPEASLSLGSNLRLQSRMDAPCIMLPHRRELRLLKRQRSGNQFSSKAYILQNPGKTRHEGKRVGISLFVDYCQKKFDCISATSS